MTFSQQLKKLFYEWLTEDIKIIPQPLPPILTQLGKTMLNYKLTLPDATAADVTSWNMETTIGTDAPTVAEVHTGDTLSYNQGATVSLRLQEVDDAGNKSDWSEPFAFTASDTLAPSQPGAPKLELISETA